MSTREEPLFSLSTARRHFNKVPALILGSLINASFNFPPELSLKKFVFYTAR